MLSQIGQKKKREAVRRLSQNASRRRSGEDRTIKRPTGIGITSREMVFGKRSLEDLANPNKKERLLGHGGICQEEGRSSSVFGNSNTQPFGSVGSAGFKVENTSGVSSTSEAKVNQFSFGPMTTQGTSAETVCGSLQTSTVFSFAGDKPQNLPQEPLNGIEKSQGSLVNTTSSTSYSTFTFGNQPSFSFGQPSVKTSQEGFSFLSGLATKSGFSKSAFSNTKTYEDLTVKPENSSTSIGFPVTPIATTSNQPNVFDSKFGQSGSFGFGKGQEEASMKKPSQQFSLKSHVFGKMPRQFGASADKDTSFQSKQKEKSSSEEKTISDISTLKTLVIREIPELFNNNAWLKRFYSRFGEVVKVFCNPGKKSASITFKTHEAAKLAKVKGKILRKEINPVSIFWKQERKRTMSSSQDVSEFAAKKSIQMPKERAVEREPAALDPGLLPAGMTGGERFKLLERIDAELREGVTKASDITTAKAVQGTCPDMCPEKERYMREDRRRLHVYEIIPGTGSGLEDNPQVDHAKAVKEYDRSAADKEEPLPHELRPIPTLKMTMDYLVTSIMDIGQEGQWGEWFDFLWNRTRAIRKDITQQHLCDLESVDLIEKTARFHIFCAHYLCDQDLGVFDPRINTENLTKCLQTLKQFYGDLYENQNVICPNEAEFRVYEILLNLNEGDTLRQVMNYREEVHSSPSVKFAMDVFHALNSNNFVRFFRLVKSSSYLCGCLLHRYFTQVRKQALRIMNYSLSVPNKEMSFPLSELTNLLAFEGDEEAANFCTFHGLTVNEPFVMFMRGSFIEPESAFPANRAYKLIESKRSCPIGQVVYNGPLPPPLNHRPISSFDHNGRYIGDAHVLPTEMEKENIQAKQEPFVKFTGFVAADEPKGFSQFRQQPEQQTQPVEPPKPALQINLEEFKEVSKNLFLEVINEMLVEVTTEVFSKVKDLLTLADEIMSEFEEQAVLGMIQEIVESAMEEERRLQLLQAEQAALKERSTSAVAEQLVDNVVAQETLEVAAYIYCAEQKKMIAKCKEAATQEITQILLDDTVKDEVKRLAEDSYREAKEGRKAALGQIGQCIRLHRTARYFNKWTRSYQARVRLKKLLNEFPAHAPLTSAEDQLTSLIGPRDDLGTKALPTIRIFGDELKVSECLVRRQAELDQIRAEVLRPIDIPLLLANSFNQKRTAEARLGRGLSLDWKLLLSFPVPCPPVNRSIIRSQRVSVTPSLIREKFRKGSLPLDDRVTSKVELLSLYSSEFQNRWSARTRCRVCTLASFGVPTNTDMTELVSKRQFQGTSATIIIVDSKELQTHPGKQELRTRVHRLLRAKPALPAIPAVVLVLENDVTRAHVTDDLIFNGIGAQELEREGHVSSVQIARVRSSIEAENLNRLLQEIVSWLGQHSEQVKLESDSLKNFLEEGLQRYFCTPLYEDIATRKKARLGEQSPEVIIGLYNGALEHLATVASSESLGQVSWPITEFCSNEMKDLPNSDWNSDAILSSLSSVILSFCFPPPPPGVEDGTWDSESLLCHEFVTSLPFFSSSLAQRVNWVLEHKRQSLQAIDFLSSSPQLTAAQVPWAQLIETCVSSAMTSIHSDPVLAEMEVFYLQSEFEEFVQPVIWRGAVAGVKQEYSAKMEEKRAQLKFPVKTRNDLAHESVLMVDEELNRILNENRLSSQTSRGAAHGSSFDNSIYELKNDLGSALLDARQEVTRFDQILEECSPGDDPSNKKRKAEYYPKQKNLNKKASLDMESVRNDLEALRKKIRSERTSQQEAEFRLRLLLDDE